MFQCPTTYTVIQYQLFLGVLLSSSGVTSSRMFGGEYGASGSNCFADLSELTVKKILAVTSCGRSSSSRSNSSRSKNLNCSWLSSQTHLVRN